LSAVSMGLPVPGGFVLKREEAAACAPNRGLVQVHKGPLRDSINSSSRRSRFVLTPLGFSLLRQLSDGAFHSGEDLAATVGLTRARVAQLLKQAETAGWSLERVRGRGYRLLATPDFLDADAVRAALAEYGVEVASPDYRPILPAANDDDLALPARPPPSLPAPPPNVRRAHV